MKIVHAFLINKKYQYQNIKREKLYFSKPIFILILTIVVLLSYKYNQKNNFEFFFCFCSMGRQENLYVRELISYYMSIGVDKFVFADNNLPNTEKFSDILQDYIKNGTVDIIEIFGDSYGQNYYNTLYENYRKRCKWLSFFDFDEYLGSGIFIKSII